ncbi:MAG: hypothetical protein ACE3JK_06495 [Sporolactobacillus sp.]
MQIPQVRTIITTTQSLNNTFNQLEALKQQKHLIQNDLDRGQSSQSSEKLTENEEKNQMQLQLGTLNQQIQKIESGDSTAFVSGEHGDTVRISQPALKLFDFDNRQTSDD